MTSPSTKRLCALLFSALLTSPMAYAGVFPDNVEAAFSKGEAANFLAGHHMKKHLACENCHPKAEISDSETAINNQCVTCHGSLKALGEKTPEKKFNPHDSHLGKINCTACHQGHRQSTSYCHSCHDFKGMAIPYGEKARPKVTQPDFKRFESMAPNFTIDTDLVIVGSGAAGSVAALEARKLGVKNIIMIERQPIPGGNSQLAAGGMNAAGTRFQADKGIEDNPDLMFKDTMKGGHQANNPALARILADHSAESIEWLAQQGAELSSVGRGGGASAPRMHGPAGGKFVGPYLQAFFKEALKKADIDIRLNTQMVRLYRDDPKDPQHVTGILVLGKHNGLYRINAKAIVIATGGIGRNKALIQSLRPDVSPMMKTSNQPGSQGDGLVLGKAIGAASVDEDALQLNPTLLVGSPVIISERVRGAGAIFVNTLGKRFVSELTTRDVTSAAILAQPDGVAFEVFDQKVRDGVKQTGAAFALDLAYEGKTLADLAKAMGVDAKTLEATVKTYNGYVDQGEDPDFKRPTPKVKIDAPNYYAIKVTPAIHHHMGGLKINESTQVLDTNDKPLTGLYAAGEVTGGVHGKNRLGGNAVSDTITFGRIAGQSAAKVIVK